MTEERVHPHPRFARVTRALHRGRLVADRVFDEVFPFGVRRASSIHWTPVEVAMRVATLLAPPPTATILDVGSGIGKFCLVAAAVLPGVRVRGVEQRSHFVSIAREAARAMGVSADFRHGTLDEEDAARIDGVYLFNPFAENLTPAEDHLDESVELSEDRFWRDIASAERFLATARVGTRVVTYCGWGGEMPPGYHLARRERCAGDLELWVKAEHATLRATPSANATQVGAATLSALRARAAVAGAAAVWDGE